MNKFDSSFKWNGIRIDVLWDRYELLVVKNIRTKSTNAHHYRLVFKQTKIPWHLEQLHRIGKSNVLNKLSGTKAGKLGLFSAIVIRVFTNLNVSAELSKFRVYVLPGFLVNTKFFRLTDRRTFNFFGLGNFFMKWSIEIMDHFFPVELSIRNFIELQLNFGCKSIVRYIREVFYQKIIYNHRGIGREKFVLFRPCYFSIFCPYYRVILKS